MSLYVLKFGGSSVATTARIEKASQIVKKIISEGNEVVVVTSAMQGVTNQLIDFTKAFTKSPTNREYDSIISSGEQVAAGLFSMCLNNMGIKAKSFLGWQIPIKTTEAFSQANIKSINANYIIEKVRNNIVPVIAGFQGISDKNEITTLGRGGSDATACAVAYAVKADECFIYTDVDGVYSADPRIVLKAKRIEKISYKEMLELAAKGAKVLQYRSVLIAKQFGIKLRVLSSFSDSGETIVTNETVYIPQNKRIAGIAHNTNLCMFTVHTNIDPTKILRLMFENKINLDFTFLHDNELSFLVEKSYLSNVEFILTETIKCNFKIDNDIGVVSVIGEGIKMEHQIIQEIFHNLETKQIKLKKISFSDVSISFIVPFQQTEQLVNNLHKLFFE